MESNRESIWVEYKCKSGETLFIYNKVTGEHKWPTNDSTKENCAMFVQPVIYKELSSIGTQTDDNGCDNGCTSMYISMEYKQHMATSYEQARDDFYVKSEVDDGLYEGEFAKKSKDMAEIDAILAILEERSSKKIDEEVEDTITSKTILETVNENNDVNQKVDILGQTTFDTSSDNNNIIQEEFRHVQTTFDSGCGNNSNIQEGCRYGQTAFDSCRDNNNVIQEGDRCCLDAFGKLKNEHLEWVVDSVDSNNSKEIGSELLQAKEIDETKLKELTSEGNIKDVLQEKLDEQIECNYCDQIFDSKSLLRAHMNEVRHFSCPYCPKKFKRNYPLKLHIRTHTGEKPFGCSDCSMRFSTKENLKMHIRKHTKEKPFGCSFCTKKYRQRAALKVHLRSHTGEKPYSCTCCEEKFATRIALNVHNGKAHNGEKPYECSVCKKKFVLNFYRKVHERVHTGEKPFECTQCGKKFPRKENLDYHLRMHTGQLPFECPFCERKYARKQRLQYHVQRTHKDEEPI